MTSACGTGEEGSGRPANGSRHGLPPSNLDATCKGYAREARKALPTFAWARRSRLQWPSLALLLMDGVYQRVLDAAVSGYDGPLEA